LHVPLTNGQSTNGSHPNGASRAVAEPIPTEDRWPTRP
jgi:hypothetical protein